MQGPLLNNGVSYLERKLHEQYTTEDGNAVLFECDVCGYRSQSLGQLHGHIERHRGYTRFGIQLPFTDTSMGDWWTLMDHTNVYECHTEEITLERVEGL